MGIIHNFVFEDGSLKRILTPEGIVEPQGGVMVYQYFIKDHLGNTRVVVDENNLVRQTNSYYPFGMLVETAQMSKLGYETNKYLYNGKELQDEFGLINMNGRVYDPMVGRFLSADPFIQEPTNSQSYNRYSYALNNPLKYTDPSGYLSAQIHSMVDNDRRQSIGFVLPIYDMSYFGPGTGNYWSDGIGRSEFGNFMLSSRSTFESMYDGGATNIVIDIMNDEATSFDWFIGRTTISDIRDAGSVAEYRVMQDKVKYVGILYFAVNESGDQRFLGEHREGYAQNMINNIVYANESIVGDIYLGDGNVAASGGLTGVPQSDAFKYSVAGTSVWGYTVEAGFDVARVTQRTVSTWSKGARVMGRTNAVLTAATIGYDFATGTANTSTLVNAGVNVAGAIVVGFVGVAAAPWVAGGLAVYGLISIAGGDEWLNSHFDISNTINFVKPAATEGTW